MKTQSLRQLWFEHVRKTRKKNSTKKAPITHREAMSMASETWPAIKARIEKKRAREVKKKAREAAEK